MQRFSHLLCCALAPFFLKDAPRPRCTCIDPVWGPRLVIHDARLRMLLKIWSDSDLLYFDFEAFTTHGAFSKPRLMHYSPSRWYQPAFMSARLWIESLMHDIIEWKTLILFKVFILYKRMSFATLFIIQQFTVRHTSKYIPESSVDPKMDCLIM